MFKKRKALGFILYPALFILLFSLFHCKEDRYYDARSNSQPSSRRNSRGELRIAENSLSGRFVPLKKNDFDGKNCKESEECENWCREMFSPSQQSTCDNLPEDMMEVLYQTYTDIEHIQSLEDLEDINPSALAVIIDIEDRTVLRLINNDWGVRGLAGFLEWVASNSLVTQAMNYRNNENVFKKALLKFAELNRKTQNVRTALSLNIGRHRETFLFYAEKSQNEEAVQFVFDLVGEECSGSNSKNCKLFVLCNREQIARSQNNGASTCPYLDDRRSNREDYCYLQGPDVWSYVQNLISDRHFTDNDLGNVSIDQDLCDRFCENNSCEI